MIEVSTEIVINKPIKVVADYVSNPDHAPDWYVNIKTIEWETEPPIRIGSKMAFKAQFLGKTLAYTYECTEWIPGQKLVMTTAQGPFPMTTIYHWQALSDSQTKMTLINKGQPKGFARVMQPLMKSAMKKANQKDLEKLKHLLESQ